MLWELAMTDKAHREELAKSPPYDVLERKLAEEVGELPLEVEPCQETLRGRMVRFWGWRVSRFGTGRVLVPVVRPVGADYEGGGRGGAGGECASGGGGMSDQLECPDCGSGLFVLFGNDVGLCVPCDTGWPLVPVETGNG